MKRTTTEILIEVEETVRVRKIKRSAANIGKLDAPTADAVTCPFCGGAFSTAEHLKNQNESKNQNEKE